MNVLSRWLPIAALLCAIPIAAQGQAVVRTWDGGGGAGNNWTNELNWSDDLAPLAFYGETALIDSGATAVVNSNLSTVLPDGGFPGGLTVSNNSKLQVNTGGVIGVVTGPDVMGAANFTSGGSLTISGASASFTSESLSFGGGGIFNPNITGAFQSAAVVNGVLAADGGILRPTFGITPTPQSWVIADAESITGAFTLDASGITLGAGSVLRSSIQSGGNGQQLVLTYDRVLTLSVNADTGAVSMSSPSGTAITITGYSIESPAGELNPGSWTPLATSLGGGWDTAGPATVNRLEELGGPIPPANTTQASLAVNATPRALGNAYAADLPFGTVPSSDMSFKYVTAAGDFVDGVVEFTGLNAVNNLLVTVGSDGFVTLKNSSTTTVNLRGYTIASQGGGLLEANWTSLDSQGVPGVDEALGGPTANFLSELVPSPNSPLELSPGETYQMGQIFNTAAAKDLELEFLMVGGSLEGDFNGDGAVNLADYTVWRDNLGAANESALSCNGNGGGVDATDYQLWKSNFGSTGGSGLEIMDGVVQYSTSPLAPLAGLSSAAVPEPSTLYLFAGLAGLALVRIRRV
jgi:hypothetical protein